MNVHRVLSLGMQSVPSVTLSKTGKMEGSGSFVARLSAAQQGAACSAEKNDALYTQARELETLFVRVMVQSMRETLSGQTLAGERSFSGRLYEDALYEHFSAQLAAQGGFGLAEKVYRQLNPRREAAPGA